MKYFFPLVITMNFKKDKKNTFDMKTDRKRRRTESRIRVTWKANQSSKFFSEMVE